MPADPFEGCALHPTERTCDAAQAPPFCFTSIMTRQRAGAARLFSLATPRVKYIIADQLAVEAKQEDESEYEGGGGASYNGGQEGADAVAAAAAPAGGVGETKGSG